MATTSTTRKASAIELIPSQTVSSRKVISAMKQETMKTSPWAKFTMPMMPNTIV